ncbi:MAG: HisA/HisF-related TIM barrel protein [Candidatus Hadarchaeales archaeon]
MKLIPVLDVREGTAVHAVGGRRKEYRPVKSVLAEGSSPLSLARAYLGLGLKEIYFADLDAIEGAGDNLSSLSELVKEGAEVMVDAGFERAEDAKPYAEVGVRKLVVATETLESFVEVERARGYGLPLVGSVDLKEGRVVARSRGTRGPVARVVQALERAGVSELLLLNLDRVGTSTGPNVALSQRVLRLTHLPLLVGGGVRGVGDLRLLKKLGVAGVLLATSLHQGRLGKEEIGEILRDP